MEIYKLSDKIPVDTKVGRNTGRSRSSAELKITDMRSALRDENRVNIYIDNKFAFSLDVAQVVELKLKVGRALTTEELAEMKSASEFGKLYQRALEWVLARPRSARETRDYLRRVQAKRRAENRRQQKTKLLPEISDQNLELVLSRLCERGYVDDKKFAKFYLENRMIKKGVSRRRLELELRGKGVSEEDISAAFIEAPRDEAAEIRKIIAKKSKRYDSEKLIQYITRQGFDYQLTRSLVLGTD